LSPDTAESLASFLSPAGSPRTSVRWSICAMLFFATSINYVDRQVLALLAPSLQHSIGWTEAQYGYIVGAFQAAYAIGLVLAGRMVDRIGCRIGFALIMGFWSLASMGHALAASALGFGIARFFLVWARPAASQRPSRRRRNGSHNESALWPQASSILVRISVQFWRRLSSHGLR